LPGRAGNSLPETAHGEVARKHKQLFMPIEPFSPIAASPLADCLARPEVDALTRTGTIRLCCPEDFAGFEGHFPGEPILPAVLQLMAVRLLAETMAGKPLESVGGERLKFKGMVRPAEVIMVRVKLREERELLRADFSLERGGAKVSSGTLVFRLTGAVD
jgi:3-hydroxyacyl-[acyl-carrier-protein] dehydratase